METISMYMKCVYDYVYVIYIYMCDLKTGQEEYALCSRSPYPSRERIGHSI